MSCLLIEGLNRGGIIDKSDNDLSIAGSRAFLNHNEVPVENPDIDHGLPLDLEHEGLFLGGKFCRKGEVVGNVLDGQKGLTGSYLANHRNIDDFSSGEIEIIIDDFNGPRLGGITADIAVILKLLQMGEDRRGRLESDRITDLADRRRIAGVQDLILDVLQDLHLLVSDLSVSHSLSYASQPECKSSMFESNYYYYKKTRGKKQTHIRKNMFDFYLTAKRLFGMIQIEQLFRTNYRTESVDMGAGKGTLLQEGYMRSKNNRYRARAQRTRMKLAIFLIMLLIGLSVLFILNRPMTASASQEKTYREVYCSIEVNQGDSLYKIADQYKRDSSVSRRQYVNKVIEINHLTSQNIRSGMSLVIPTYVDQE